MYAIYIQLQMCHRPTRSIQRPGQIFYNKPSNHRREGVSAERRIRREINWEHGLCRLSWRSRGFLQCIKFSIKIHILRYTRKKFNHIPTTVKIIRYNIKHNLKYIYTGILKVLYSYLLTMHIQKLLLHYSEFISFQEDTIP